MIYCIDTSALIDLERYYPYSVFSPLWDNYLITLVKQKRLITSQEVEEELKRGDDSLYKWFMSHCREMFIKTDTQLLEKMADILNMFPNFSKHHRPDKNWADPFVIALAVIYKEKNEKISVVVHEQATGNLNGPKMPDICRSLKIRPIKLVDMFKNEKWKL